MRKMSGGLGALPRLDPSPRSLFPPRCFRFPDYLGAWNRLMKWLRTHLFFDFGAIGGYAPPPHPPPQKKKKNRVRTPFCGSRALCKRVSATTQMKVWSGRRKSVVQTKCQDWALKANFMMSQTNANCWLCKR